MSNIRKVLIISLYSIQSIFALGLGFFGHHEKEHIAHATENSCERQGNCCSSTMNSCISLYIHKEFGINNHKPLEIPDIDIKKSEYEFLLTKNQTRQNDQNTFPTNTIPIQNNKSGIGISKIVV